MFELLQSVYDGRESRLIINIPPRHGKTELLILFVAYIYARNKRANNIYLSYSDTLSIRASGIVQQYVTLPEFQYYWPMQLIPQKKGWSHWIVSHGGEMLGVATGGQVTGFGAGVTGAHGGSGGVLIIDDPNKPDLMNYDVYRKKIQNSFTFTVKNRRNSTRTPIVVIMQRLHEEDLSGFLLGGGDGHYWQRLKIPVYDERGAVIFPEKYSQLEAQLDQSKLPEIFSGQYLQEPSPAEGAIWKKEWFEIIAKEQVPFHDTRFDMYIDGAYTKDTKNDPTGILIAGKSKRSKSLYILHNESKRLEMPDLLRRIIALYRAYDIGIVLCEPRASGKTIVQLLKDRGIRAANIDTKWNATAKIDKANDCSPYIEGGMVYLIKGAWNDAYLAEVAMFPKGKHDEAVDNTAYAIERTMMRQVIQIFLDKSEEEQKEPNRLKFIM